MHEVINIGDWEVVAAQSDHLLGVVGERVGGCRSMDECLRHH